MTTAKKDRNSSVPRTDTPPKRTRKRTSSRALSHEDPVKEAKGQKMVQRIRDYHALGTRLNDQPETVEQVSRVTGTHVTTLYKARAFAQQYSDVQLKRLCELRRPNSLPLHWGYIPILLTVNPEEREKLENEAAAENWSVNRLIEEIKGRFPEKRRKTKSGNKGGRPQSAARQDLSQRISKIIDSLGELADRQASSKTKRAVRAIIDQVERLEEQLRLFGLG